MYEPTDQRYQAPRAWRTPCGRRFQSIALLALFLLPGLAIGQTEREFEDVFWESVECGSALQVQAYLEQYPTGAYVTTARACLERQLGLDRAARVLVQQGLAAVGQEPGSADGLFDGEGSRTREAIRTWQATKGLAATGYVTRAQAETLMALGQEAVTAAEAERQAEEQRRTEAERQRTEAERQRTERPGELHDKYNMTLLAAAELLERGESGAAVAAAALGAGADPNFRDDAGRTALMNTMLSNCRYTCDEELVTILLANGADPNLQDEDGNTALMLVAERTDYWDWAVKYFYRDDYHPDPFTAGSGSILGILHDNDPYSVLFAQLLKGGADPTLPNKAGDTVVKIAEARGETALADVLREAGGDPKFGLLRAAAKGKDAEVVALLAGGAAVNLQSGDGRTALRLAAQAGHGTVVAELLAGGAEVNLQSGDGRTALMDAAANSHGEVVTALLAAGADPNVQDESGNTALLYATWRTGNSEVIRALLAGGANPNTRGRRVSALEHTAMKGDAEAVAALLTGGADPNLQGEYGPALKLAEKEGHSAIADMLRKAGAANAERPRELQNSIGMEFMLIEPGTFEMGSPETEPGRKDDETLRTVTITQPFYLGKYEVTQGQWQAVMGNNPSRFPSCGQNCPVERVSWEDVQEYIRELNRREGTEGYRLPTEAEWEFAARGGQESRGYVYAGSDRLDLVGWCADGSDVGSSHPVGQKRPNELGLYDMSGNVLEWVQNWLGPYPSGALTNPRGPSTGDHRIVRGGSWRRPARWCRAAHYASAAPSTRYVALGFRLARTP